MMITPMLHMLNGPSRVVSDMHSFTLNLAGDPSRSAQDLPPGSLSWTLSCDDEYIVTAFQQPAHRPCWGYRVQEADRWVPHVGCFTVPPEPFCDPTVLFLHAVAHGKKLSHTQLAVYAAWLAHPVACMDTIGTCLSSHLIAGHGP